MLSHPNQYPKSAITISKKWTKREQLSTPVESLDKGAASSYAFLLTSMQIHIVSADHTKITAAIHTYVAEKIGHLEHYEENIISAHVVLHHDPTRAAKHAFVVKVHLALPGPDLHAEDKGHDLYQAIDLVSARLNEQLRHRKSKLTRGRRKASSREKQKRRDQVSV
jgi:putative sigma-54 modulation protein